MTVQAVLTLADCTDRTHTSWIDRSPNNCTGYSHTGWLYWPFTH